MKKSLQFIMGCLFIATVFTSCVEDTDFDQASDISFTPEVELNLIYFNLVAGEFFNEETQTPRLVVRDTTDLEFLDGSDLTQNIKQIDFTFNFTNTIQRSFEVDFQFITLSGEVTYQTGTIVSAGSPSEAVESVFEETVAEADVENLTRAGQVIVTVTIPEANASLEGELNLKSKTIYYIEY